jgi:threonylcarbamoyladenosine tRNA methylthiotransferase MtaB
LQSGDDRILKLMKRPYNTARVAGLLEEIFRRSPETCIGMDVMVGFPSEDAGSFASTAMLIERLRPSYLHVFPFSPRPGTAAASFEPKVPRHVAHRRAEALRALSACLRKAFYQRFLGKILAVVPERISESASEVVTARSDNYIPVNVVRNQIAIGHGAFRVEVKKVAGEKVWAVPVQDEQ